ncbi:threonine synthase [Ahrensia kielensis]|uniref:threonine synthase n=1 Tax=Ahrensia kielensis TaxID=76980 RepID=UPI00047691ED|nr:threonine synthase [Ahrensia kielensis]
MKYVSTRGQATALSFRDTMLAGLASDGGLFVPESWPQFSHDEIAKLAGKSYSDVAIEIMWPFVEGEIERAAFESIVRESYATFRHDAVCPLVQTGDNEFLLELFHGPTLAFKDVAMQLIGRLMDHVLTERDQRATIVGATSGDTGGAAIDAFAGRDRTDMFILFPEGRVSPVQQRQMTSSTAINVHALAIDGNFDDCQAHVKSMFNHADFRNSVSLSGINSINWARIMAQIVYYFTSAVSLGAPHRTVSFCVPTGNFGDIFAGYAAKQMGLPIDKLIIATNDNDILARTLETGSYSMSGVVETTSPSMDIQISSNFERLLYKASDDDDREVTAYMGTLKQSGEFTIKPETLKAIRSDFLAGRADVGQAKQTIKDVAEQCSYTLDPHSAIGVHVARNHKRDGVPMIVLGTAHPAKFPDAVKQATGVEPDLPAWLGDLMSRKENFTPLSSDLKIIEDYISKHTRA